MKKLSGILCLILAALTVLSFAACGNPTGQETTTPAQAELSTGDPTGQTEASTVDAQGYQLDDLPEKMSFDIEDPVTLLYWQDCERPEFEIKEEEVNGALVESAIFNRNLRTEERLGITFEWIGQDGDNGDRAKFVSFVENNYAGGTYFDIIATYSRTSAMLISRGYLKNLNGIDNSYLNFSQPWWPKTMLETCTINGKIYSVSGDISTNILHFMYCIYYNMDMREDLGIEDPIPLVDSKQWTIDKLIELTKGVNNDLNQNGKKDPDDGYGFVSIYYGLDAFYTGSGLRLVEQDPVNTLKISDDFTSTKCVDLMDKLGAWIKTEVCYVDSNYNYSFADGNTLFMQNRVYAADGKGSDAAHNLNGVDWTYGILPTPLYDTDQPEYITVVGNPFTLWGIERGTDPDKASRATAVIECMASYGYRLTTPALFETNMKYRYTTDNKGDAVRMFDIIHDTIAFDLGRIFSDDLLYMSEMPSKCAAAGTSWASQMGRQVKSLNTNLNKKVIPGILEKSE